MLANQTEWQCDWVELSQLIHNHYTYTYNIPAVKKGISQQTLVLALVCRCWVDLEEGVVAGDPRPDVLGEELCLNCLSVTVRGKPHHTEHDKTE